MKKSVINEKPFVVTEKDCKLPWRGRTDGSKFRCGICGQRFAPGDTIRFVFANMQSPSYGNFFVCEECDGEDVIERRNQKGAEYKKLKKIFG